MQAKLARRSHGAVAELRWLIWQVPFGSFCATTLLYIRIIYGYVYLYCITKCFVFLSYFLVKCRTCGFVDSFENETIDEVLQFVTICSRQKAPSFSWPGTSSFTAEVILRVGQDI